MALNTGFQGRKCGPDAFDGTFMAANTGHDAMRGMVEFIRLGYLARLILAKSVETDNDTNDGNQYCLNQRHTREFFLSAFLICTRAILP